jgi:hypothetical protein
MVALNSIEKIGQICWYHIEEAQQRDGLRKTIELAFGVSDRGLEGYEEIFTSRGVKEDNVG